MRVLVLEDSPADLKKALKQAADDLLERLTNARSQLQRLETATRDTASAERKVRLWLDKAKKVSALYAVTDPAARKKVIDDLDATWVIVAEAQRDSVTADVPVHPDSDPGLVSWLELVDFTLRPPVSTGNGATDPTATSATPR